MSGVVLANLAPTAPFVILVMIPYIEQIDPRFDAAARVFGADTPRLFAYVLLPLLAPGVLAALLLALVRTIAMFELTFLTNGPTRRSSSRSTTPSSPPVFAPCSRSTRWPSSIWLPR